MLTVAILALYAAAYLRRARTLARRGHPVPAWRLTCFTAGLAVLAGALIPPLDAQADRRLVAHMAQHLLIADVASLLLVLGLSGPLLAPLLRIRPIGRLRALGHPAVAFVLWSVNLWLWHLPALYVGAERHDLLHAVEHGCFLVFGAGLWLPLLGPFPRPAWFGGGARVAYVLAVRVSGAALANLFVWSDTVFYSWYGDLGDQRAAGALMMVEESVLMVAVLAWLVVWAIRDAGDRQELAELADARGVAVDHRRIARAVAAGRGADLRRRLAAEHPDQPAER